MKRAIVYGILTVIIFLIGAATGVGTDRLIQGKKKKLALEAAATVTGYDIITINETSPYDIPETFGMTVGQLMHCLDKVNSLRWELKGYNDEIDEYREKLHKEYKEAKEELVCQ